MILQLLISLIIVFVVSGVSARSAELKPLEFPLKIGETPKDQWEKKRLEAQVKDGVLMIADSSGGEFNDASFWQLNFNQKLPYGRKELTFKVKLGSKHMALWGGALLQPLINGREPEAALKKDGSPDFKKIIAADGKGFIPARSAVVRLTMDKSEKILNSFAFMTAGAANTNIGLSDFKVTVWPEKEAQMGFQNVHISQLGYAPRDTKVVFVEWKDSTEDEPRNSVELSVKGPDGLEEIRAVLPSNVVLASQTRVSRINVSHLTKPGSYELVLPQYGKDRPAKTARFDITDNVGRLTKIRDDAWSAFYWMTDTEDGPYPEAHQQDENARMFQSKGEFRNVRGGWFDAGDYGKYSVNAGYSVSLMLLTGLLSPDALDHSITPLAGGVDKRPDWLDVADTALEWLLKMQRKDGGVYHKAASRNWPSLDESPEEDKADKWVMPVSSTATAIFAGTTALAARIYRNSSQLKDQELAPIYYQASVAAIKWLKNNPALDMPEKSYDGHDYGGPYTDEDDSDERFFAFAAYAAMTGEKVDFDAIARLVDQRSLVFEKSGFESNWAEVDLLSFWALMSAKTKLPSQTLSKVEDTLRGAANHWRSVWESSSWSITLADDAGFPWGSNSVIALAGWHGLLWAEVGGEMQMAEPAHDQLHWFFGLNPLGQTFVTGQRPENSKNPHFRPVVSGRIKLPDGFLVGGPNSLGLAGDPLTSQLAGKPPMHMYVDDKESYATNEVAINWQSTWAVYTSLLVQARLRSR